MLQDLEAQLQCDFNGQTPTIARLQADIELLSQGHHLQSRIELLIEDQRRYEVLIETQQKVIETQRQEMKNMHQQIVAVLDYLMSVYRIAL